MTAPEGAADPPALDLAGLFEGARLVVVGGTGFLGKVWLSLFLHRYPGVGRVYLVVRARAGRESEARFWTDVAGSEPFSPLRELYPGAAFEDFLRDKIEVLDADVSRPRCGVPEAQLRELSGTIDAVVNVAGVVDFNPPLDEALKANAAGVQNLVGLAKALGDVPVLHTSTCYVAGYRRGTIDESDPRARPIPSDEVSATHWSPAREIDDGHEIVAQVLRRADDAQRRTLFHEEALRTLAERGEPGHGPPYDEEVSRARRRWVKEQSVAEGAARALHWGWPNIYTYTKALGEQVLAGSGLQFAIVRPSVIESSVAYPFAGWNEGINTMAPLIFVILKGHLQVPVTEKVVLDVIPVDMVAGGMILALGALLQRTHRPVYHLGSSDTNPVRMLRIVELVGLYKRKYFQRTGKLHPAVSFVVSHWEPTALSVEAYRSRGAPAIARASRGLSGLLQRAAGALPLGGVLKPAARALDAYAGVAKRNGELWELFVPFIAETEYRFSTLSIRAARARVSAEDRRRVGYEPEGLDWRHYMHEVQCPGLDRWVFPDLRARIDAPQKPLRAYAHLVDMLADAAERHGHIPALLRVEADGLSRVSYQELFARAGMVACRLQAAGITVGDRVALSAGNHPSWAIAYFGVLRAGAVAVPVDPKLEARAFGNVLRASHARAVVWDEEVRGRVEPMAPEGLQRLELLALTDPDPELPEPAAVALTAESLASVIYTSGTTGTPKGVMLSHGNFTSLIASLAPVFPLSTGDRALSVLPLHHTFEFTCGLLLPLSRGSRVVYLDELTGERVVHALREARVTAMVGVPALWQLLERRIVAEVRERGSAASAVFDLALTVNRTLGKNLGADVGRVLFGPVHQRLGGSLRYLISGGAALPRETSRVFAGLGLHLAEGYGLTEAAPVLTVSKAGPRGEPGSVGAAIPGVELRIANPDAQGVGEVWARGANVMTGYMDDPEGTAGVLDSDGWLRTGDLGRLDAKGRLTLVGRSKDVIVASNGENIYPDDVERAVGKVDGISEYAVVGVPDPRGGERGAVLAVPQRVEEDTPEARAARRERAHRSLRQALAKLPPAWQPSVVLLYDAALPRTAIGKARRNEVRAILARLLSASIPPPPRGGDGGAEPMTPVRRAVAVLARVEPERVTGATRLKQDLGFDSLMAMELVVALEAAQVGVPIPEDLGSLETVAEIEEVLGLSDGTGARGVPLPSLPEDVSAEDAPREDPEATAVELPEAVRDLARSALSVFQREFYRSVMKSRVTGRSFIPHNRNTIVVANHASHLDMGLVKHALGSYGRDLVALAARDYFYATTLRRTWVDNFTNLAPINREGGLAQTLREVGRLLEQGKTVLIFPEGTRSPDGTLRKFKGAVGFLALHYRVDVLPVYLGGTYDALPKHGLVPTRRDLSARIGPALAVDELLRLTQGMRPMEAARAVARLTQQAVEALRDGGALDLSRVESVRAQPARRHPLVELFAEELPRRFQRGTVTNPVSFYFTLGNEPEAKWTVRVSPEVCEVVPGKPEGGAADCVLKTSADLFTRIVREGYTPGAGEFLSGAVKSNDVALLETFQRAFQLG